jgi:CubicO group peptidase (beta-lactamase class C family)
MFPAPSRVLESAYRTRVESSAGFMCAQCKNEATTIAQRGKIPGAIILIQQHGQPVYLQSFGVRDVKSKLPITPDTIFRLFSMTKPITSVAAMLLINQGKLALGDPIAKYIPSFANVKGRRRKAIGQRRTQPGIGSAEPTHNRRRSDAANLRHHVWLLWREPGPEGVSRR